MAVINGTINIDWFGDQKKYEKSPIKIITVGLNPSDREFSDNTHPLPNVSLRFPGIPASLIPVHPQKGYFPNAWNNYFNYNPLDWFANFERVLRGFGASYGGTKLKIKEDENSGNNYPLRAIHTDFCTPWATIPTWQDLSPLDQRALITNYTNSPFSEWISLVNKLKPDIIIACIPQKYRKALMGSKPLTDIIHIVHTKTGARRNRPVIIRADVYQGALIVFGQTQNVPFGNVSTLQKNRIGQIINNCYQHWKTSGNLSTFTPVVI